MPRLPIRHLGLLTAALLSLLTLSCHRESGGTTTPAYRPWSDIVAGDTLRVGTMTSPTDFYIYRGEPFGIEYQKAVSFAKAKGLKLETVITGSRDSLMKWLDEGVIDISITPFAMTADNSATYDFAGAVDTIAFVLVQNGERGDLIRDVHDLDGKSIYVSANSTAEMRLHQIAAEAALDSLHILPVDSIGDVDLVMGVACTDSISYTVVDTRLATLFASHYPALDTNTRLSVAIRYSWMIHRGNDTLAAEIDDYFSGEEGAAGLDESQSMISSSYFFRDLTESSRYAIPAQGGMISPFDQIFIHESERLGWHWTYLAAIAYTESRFTPNIIGRSGARGLMGIMPRTGQIYGATPEELLDPTIAVQVAVDCLRDNESYFRFIDDQHERECFTLAAYNAGSGHVMDAIRLARKHGANDSIWEGGVREYLLLKSTPKYFNDPVVKYGYVRGSETVKYVDDIMILSSLYRAHTEV